jgi:two-component system, NarL family, nitrate/nitrite response regulator NarL
LNQVAVIFVTPDNSGRLVASLGGEIALDPVVNLAVVEDNLILVDGLRAWVSGIQDIRLVTVTHTVDELLTTTPRGESFDVVLLDAALRAEPDPAVNARRLLDAGYRVLVMDGSSELGLVARTMETGVQGYLTRDHDLAALAATLRAIAAGGTAWSIGPTTAAEPDGYPVRPVFSEREHAVLMAYASGRTLESTARYLGISIETAKTYLKRIKAKYQMAGLPVYTKLELAEQVRTDCGGGVCPRTGGR